MIQTPLVVFNCPSRRPLALYPTWQTGGGGDMSQMYAAGSSVGYASPSPMVAKTDYAANGGDVYTSPGTNSPPWHTGNDEGGPTSFKMGTSPTAIAYWKNLAAASTGIVFGASTIRPAHVTDGMSNTYLFGEKYLSPDDYSNGADAGDNETAYTGANEDTIRHCYLEPIQDMPGEGDRYSFGSPHPSGFTMVFCDGSVHNISFFIDLQVHAHLSNRSDGQRIPGDAF
jgi:prepilin-type processing-associated H-X9-DG protein